ncbi:MAG: tripartite tricarboxylate transporter substrate binding protein [Proteobacteria bacterium]|nr:tripartite tricarboxylate transporter substrate binding protein [Pseudomonadota bacterium]
MSDIPRNRRRLPSRRLVLAGAALVAGVAVLPGFGAAQEKFPSKTIEVISHAAPGGGTDITARMMMIRTRAELGVDIVVTYQRGGGARKAHEYFAAQPADGYTVMALTQTHLYEIAQGKSPIKIDDIVGVARAMDDPTFVVVGKDSPYKTWEDLVAASKQKELTWGVAQIGSTEHIGLAQVAKIAGMKYKVVPFGSGGKMVNALMSGAIDGTLPNVSEAKSQIEDGTFRALLALNPKRLKDFPNVPTSFEKGIKVKVTTTRGYGVKKGTPPDRIKVLEQAMLKAMKHEVFVNYLKGSGLDPADSIAGAAEWDGQLKEEYAAAYATMKDLGLAK